MVATDVAIVGAEYRTAFAGALYDVDQRRIRSEVGVSECISAPEVNIPFAVAVPFRAWRNIRHLLHLFSRIFARTGIGGVGIITEARRDRGFCFGAFATEEPGEGHKHISNRSTRGATEQG